jgi:hypothetical protein
VNAATELRAAVDTLQQIEHNEAAANCFPSNHACQGFLLFGIFLGADSKMIRVHVDNKSRYGSAACLPSLKLVFNVLKYLWDRGQDTSSLNDVGLRIVEKIHRQENPRLLRMKHRVASELLRKGRSKEAQELEMLVLHCPPKGHMAIQFIFSLYGLAEIWKKRGRLGSAERVFGCNRGDRGDRGDLLFALEARS